MTTKIQKTKFQHFRKSADAIYGQLATLLALLILGKGSYYGIMNIGFALKYILMAVAAAVFARELEILLYTHFVGIRRGEAVCFVKGSRPEITALIMVLILPYTVALSALLLAVTIALVLGKEVFGGFSYNIFNPAAVGIVFLVQGYQDQLAGSNFSFLTDSFLSILFGKASYPLPPFFGGEAATLLFIGGILAVFTLMRILGMVNLTMPLSLVASLLIISLAYTLSYGGPFLQGLEGEDFGSLLLFLFFHSMLGIIFLIADPVTTPQKAASKVVVALLIGILAFYIFVFLGDPYGIFYAILLGNAVTPLLNRKMKETGPKALLISLLACIIISGLGGYLFGLLRTGWATPL